MVQRNALRSFLLAPLACTLLAQLCAQDSLLDPRKLVLIDRVVATVNDTVILYSELKTLSSGEERTAEIQKGGKLTLPELRIIQTRNLQELINRAALAQAAKTLGVLPPERVEEIFQEMLEDDRKQQIRDFGTLMKFSEELQKPTAPGRPTSATSDSPSSQISRSKWPSTVVCRISGACSSRRE